MDYFEKFVRPNFLEHLEPKKLPAFQALAAALASKGGDLKITRYPEGIKHGTTIVALKYDKGNGIVMAADRRMSDSSGDYEDNCLKISDLGENSLLAFAGSVAVCQQVEEELHRIIEASEDFLNVQLGVEAQARQLRNVLVENTSLIDLFYGLFALPIIAGYDFYPGYKRAYIFWYDAFGGFFEADKYQAVGSGADKAVTTLDDFWRYDAGKEEAVKVAVKAIFNAGKRNLHTSSAPFSPPLVKIASAKGNQTLSEEKSFVLFFDMYKEMLEKAGDSRQLSFLSQLSSSSNKGAAKKRGKQNG